MTVALRNVPPGEAIPESVVLLDGGGQAYPRMLMAIERAQASIHLEVYAFTPTGIGARFIEALGHAAGRGVKVQVQIDGWGSARGGLAVAAALRASGCAVRIYNRMLALLIGRFGRNHRKLLLVDDEVAFLGGINIGDENVDQGVRLAWADLALEIRGPQCAHLGRMIRGESDQSVDSALQLHLCGLGGGWRLRRRYLKAFTSARQRIYVAHGYFLPDRGIVRAITAAAHRGVEVRLLLAGRCDVPFARAATRSLYRRLLRAGVVIHEWSDSVLHAKVATVDGRRLLVGSFNLDPLSLANLETLVEVTDTHLVEQAEAWIENHFSRSRSMTSVEASTWRQRWMFDPLGRLVARLADMIGVVIASRKLRRLRPKKAPTPMSTLTLPVVLALVLSSAVAHGSPDVAPSTQSATQIPARASHTVIEGIFVRYHETPNRDIDGIVLEDGTMTRFAPIKRRTRSASFRPGDSVRIEGDIVSGLAGPYLVHAVVTTSTVPLARGEMTRSSPAGLPPRVARPGKATLKDSPPSPRRRLKTVAAKIRETTTGKPKPGTDSRWSRTQETSAP